MNSNAKEIKKFLKTLAWGLLPVAVVNLLLVGGLVGLSAGEDLTYVNYASALDKEHRLDSLAGQPRLVIIGGSNTRFGFDSRVLRDSLGLEPVNMGVHIGLGLDFMFDEVEDRLAAGDVLLVSAEYNHFFDRSLYDGDEGLTDMYLMKHEWGKALAHVVETQNYFSLYSLLRKRLKRRGTRPEDISERMEVRTKYNAFGDYVGHYGLSSRPWKRQQLAPCPDTTVVADVARRVQALRQRGVDVRLLPPPYARSQYAADSAAIACLADALQRRGLAFALPPASVAYADSLFYDSYYHLTRAGVLRHSRQVAGNLMHSIRSCE